MFAGFALETNVRFNDEVGAEGCQTSDNSSDFFATCTEWLLPGGLEYERHPAPGNEVIANQRIGRCEDLTIAIEINPAVLITKRPAVIAHCAKVFVAAVRASARQQDLAVGLQQRGVGDAIARCHMCPTIVKPLIRCTQFHAFTVPAECHELVVER